MKLLAAYILFFYTAAIFKPVLPYVADFVAHLVAHEHHISTVHGAHGHDHAHHEAADAAADTDEKQDIPQYKFAEPVSVHHVAEKNDEWIVTTPATIYCMAVRDTTIKPLLPVLVPPPRSL
jgi:hypothetical protein